MRKMKGLFKRGNVYWIAYRVNGKLRRETTGTMLQREAEYILTCRRKEVKEGKHPEVKKIRNCKVAELAQDYLVWTERQRVYKTKKIWVRQLVDAFGNLNVTDLNPKIIEQWQSERLKKNKPSTVNRLTTCLKHLVNKGVEWGMASEETLKCVRKVKLLEENNKRLRFLTVEECQTLIDYCTPHLKPIVTVALHTGMRRGEILGLRWDQVDLRHHFILLNMTKNGDRREIPINTTLEELFNSIPRGIESEYVFTAKEGKPYGEVKHSFQTALKKAGIQDFRFHDLRHTFASHLVMAGIDITSVKELLGHKSLTMTLRYAHLAPGHKRKAVNILDQLMRNDQSEKSVHNLFTVSESDPPTPSHKSLQDMVGDIGLEPMTPCL